MATKLQPEIERIKCREDFLYFWLNYCQIGDESSGTVQAQAWPHLLGLVEILRTQRLVVILKAKKIGISWLLAQWALGRDERKGEGLESRGILFRPNANVLMFSKGEDEAKVLFAKTKFTYGRLPPFLALKLGIDSLTEMTFPSLNSRVKAFPSTQDAGIGEAAGLVEVDEADFHPFAEANYAEAKPTTDDLKGQMIYASTINPFKQDTLFQRLWLGAMDGANGFYPVFFPYDVRPGRDEAWRKQQEREYPEKWQMEKAYPRSEEEAFALPESLGYFERASLFEMKQECRNPIETRGITRIWKKPTVGRKYVCGFDHSEGSGGDNCVGHIMDARTGETVAVIASNRTSPDIFTKELFDLTQEYGGALINYERNQGKLIKYKLDELKAKNIYYEKKDPKKPGTLIGGSNKPVIMGLLAEGIRNRDLVCWDKETIKECFDFIRDGEQLQARQGAKDDRVMAWAHANYIRGAVPLEKKRVAKAYTPFFR